MDHVKVYRLNHDTGKLKIADVIRCKIESAPRHVKMSKDGRFVYVVHEWKCFIGVYKYEERDGVPYFDHVQDIYTTKNNVTQGTTASALSFSADYSYLLSTNSGDNSVAVFDVNKEDGTLKLRLRKFLLILAEILNVCFHKLLGPIGYRLKSTNKITNKASNRDRAFCGEPPYRSSRPRCSSRQHRSSAVCRRLRGEADRSPRERPW